MSLERNIIEKLHEGRMNESGAHPNFEDEDLARYKGKPLKEFLKAVSGKTRLNIDCSRPNHYGTSGFGGMANSVTWCYADLVIKSIKGGDGKLIDVYIKV